MDVREAEDSVNDFGRPAVGETKEEAVSHPTQSLSSNFDKSQDYNKRTTYYLSQAQDDLAQYTSTPPTSVAAKSFPVNTPLAKEKIPREKGKKGKQWKLEEVERWTMVKRIW